jgi:hypothetical protein
MADAAKDEAKRAQGDPPGGGVEEEPRVTHEPTGCPVAWCPICMAVTAVQPLKPEVIEHLLKAGTEMLLAFRGVIDARADEMQPPDDDDSGPTRLEKIDIG